MPLRSALILSLALALPCTAALSQPTRSNRTPILVELFTSEGCSSCPPADALLARLDRLQPIDGAQIIILEEHVDYWNSGGWHDRFSSSQYTARQSEYVSRLRVDSGSYTPQMVVDGTDQFVGNDARRALTSIASAARTPKATLTLTGISLEGHRISATVSAPGLPFQGDLYAALVDPSDSTVVKAGENGGRHLDHAGVVRTMQRIGSLKDLSAGPRTFSLNAPTEADPASMRLVVFAQRSGQGPIAAVTSAPLKP